MDDLPEAASRALDEAERQIAKGDLTAASVAWRRARHLAGSSPRVPHRVALALEAAGHATAALPLRLAAYRLAPQDATLRHALVGALSDFARSGQDLAGVSQENRQALVDLISTDDITPEVIAPALLGLFLTGPILPRLLHVRSVSQLSAVLDEPPSQALFADTAWLTLLTRALQTYAPLEELLTRLRRLALSRLDAPDAPRWLLAPQPAALAALACQAQRGSFAWAETSDEREAAEALARRLADAPPGELSPALLLLGAYRPLPVDRLDFPPPSEAWSALAWRRLVGEVQAARRAAQSVPSLTPVQDAASARVAAQYEANPYPRWLATARQARQPLPALLTEVLPEVPDCLPAETDLAVLVAGCGTGLHAVRAASAYERAQVTAIDLSRAALGYAACRAQELGIANLRFAQADILSLDASAGDFDVIECVGVLHHLANPLAGWRRLQERLRPRGLMRIGLYRRDARRRLAGARALAGLDPAQATADSLRQARARIRAAAGTPAADAVLGVLDFHDLDGLRDLLFHVQETDYDCDRIAAELAQLGLEFLGYELPDPAARAAFRRDNASPGAARDLRRWQRFERSHPDAFAGMYLFWCRPSQR